LLTTQQVEQFIRGGETLRVEFKGETRRQLSDGDIYEAVVCLANTEGGVLLLGIEDDGRVTGASPRHGGSTDPHRLQAAIFNNTEPPVNTRVSVHTVNGQPVLAIEVDPYPEVCATKDGKTLRRVLGVQGPECQPFYPHQYASRRSDLGLFDYSAQVIEGATWDDLDPLEFERVRQTVRRLHGDAVLATLDDRQLAQAMRLVESKGSKLVPNAAGLLCNLLVHEPKPRNPRLTETARRIGLVETTGRGIDKIYIGQLRYGRPLPDYSQSDREGVRLTLRGGDASLAFAAFVYEQDKSGKPLMLDELLALNQLQHERRIDAAVVGTLTQRGEAYARGVLERLVERGLLEPKGEKRGRVYHLSAGLYRKLGQPAAYVRAHGFDPIRQEAMVMEYVTAHGRITRGEVMNLCMVTGRQASALLRRMVDGNKLVSRGSPPRWIHYEFPPAK